MLVFWLLLSPYLCYSRCCAFFVHIQYSSVNKCFVFNHWFIIYRLLVHTVWMHIELTAFYFGFAPFGGGVNFACNSFHLSYYFLSESTKHTFPFSRENSKHIEWRLWFLEFNHVDLSKLKKCQCVPVHRRKKVGSWNRQSRGQAFILLQVESRIFSLA